MLNTIYKNNNIYTIALLHIRPQDNRNISKGRSVTILCAPIKVTISLTSIVFIPKVRATS